MTNFEFYKDDIKALGYNFGMLKDGKIVGCAGVYCNGCRFREGWSCSAAKIKWLYEEYIEKPKLTANERKLCEILKYKYLARDKDESLYAFDNKPCKCEEDVVWDLTGFCGEINCRLLDCNFSFIKWEDDEPWAVEDLLKLEVE